MGCLNIRFMCRPATTEKYFIEYPEVVRAWGGSRGEVAMVWLLEAVDADVCKLYHTYSSPTVVTANSILFFHTSVDWEFGLR